MTGASGIGCRCAAMCLHALVSASRTPLGYAEMDAPHICIVTPMDRRSLTLMTLLMTSLPRSSNTSTFHIGSPSSLTMDVAGNTSPLL